MRPTYARAQFVSADRLRAALAIPEGLRPRLVVHDYRCPYDGSAVTYRTEQIEPPDFAQLIHCPTCDREWRVQLPVDTTATPIVPIPL